MLAQLCGPKDNDTEMDATLLARNGEGRNFDFDFDFDFDRDIDKANKNTLHVWELL